MTQAEDPRVGLAQNRTSMVTFRTQRAIDRNYPCLDSNHAYPGDVWFWYRWVFRALREKTPTARSIEMASGRHLVRRPAHRSRSRCHN